MSGVKKDLDSRLPDFLRCLRKEAGLSQDQMAELLGDNQTTVSRMEQGKKPVSWEVLDVWVRASGKHWMDVLVWWLGCIHEEDFADLALRALQVETPEEMPPSVRRMAMGMLTHYRRALDALVHGIEPEEDGVDQVLEEIENLVIVRGPKE